MRRQQASRWLSGQSSGGHCTLSPPGSASSITLMFRHFQPVGRNVWREEEFSCYVTPGRWLPSPLPSTLYHLPSSLTWHTSVGRAQPCWQRSLWKGTKLGRASGDSLCAAKWEEGAQLPCGGAVGSEPAAGDPQLPVPSTLCFLLRMHMSWSWKEIFARFSQQRFVPRSSGKARVV